MMMMFRGSVVAYLSFFANVHRATGHGYILEPPARNVKFEGKNGNCPHCGNGNGICGDGNQWPSGSNYYASVQSPQRTYSAGSVVELEISMNVNHKGHHEFFVCDRPIGSDTFADIRCLQQWPLMRASPQELGLNCVVNDPREDCQPIDPNYPGRWYHPPGMSIHKISYRIPRDLQCSHCTLQWFWPTSNSAPYDVPSYSCYAKELKARGWSVFDFCGWACSDDKCPIPYVIDPSAPRAPDPAKTSGFEEFRNCADIKVLGGLGPTPTRLPVAQPTAVPMTIALPSSQPTAMPSSVVPSSPVPPTAQRGSKQLVAFVENWKPCPSLGKIKGYTKVIVSFAVSYAWNIGKNICSSTCQIGTPAICANSDQPGLIQTWQAAGTKVLLSFGGAGMGGSWAGDVNDCWEACFDRVDSVVSQLTGIVNAQNFDGVDIDYEYFHTQKSKAFLKDLTVGLRTKLGFDKIVSHAPMDGDIVKGKLYFEVLREVASSVDFVLPQYYNGPFRPAQSLTGPLNHMRDLINEVFGGDQSKVVFGFCIEDCSGTGSNVNREQAVSILQAVNAQYPNHGGAFLWAASDDNEWSGPVAEVLGLKGEPITPTPPVSPTPATPAPPISTKTGACTGEPCTDASHCRSQWGYCGPSSDSDYCNADSTWTADACSGTLSPTLMPTTPVPVTPMPTPYPTPMPTPYPTPVFPPSDAPSSAPETAVCTAAPGVGLQPTDEDCRKVCMLLPKSIWPCDGTGPCLCLAEPSPSPTPLSKSAGGALIQTASKSRRARQHFLGTALIQSNASVKRTGLISDHMVEL